MLDIRSVLFVVNNHDEFPPLAKAIGTPQIQISNLATSISPLLPARIANTSPIDVPGLLPSPAVSPRAWVEETRLLFLVRGSKVFGELVDIGS